MSDDDVSTGELKRSITRLTEAIAEMRIDMKVDRHLLAGRIDAHGIQLAIHAEQIKTASEQQSGARTWIAGVVSGGLVGGLALLWEKLTK